jgi:hypothetical protein
MQHEVLDDISLELGRRVAARLREEPGLLQLARDNLERWLGQNAHSPALVRCYREWQCLLEQRPLEDICRVLDSDGEENRRLRQNSPFAGLLRPSEVWSVKAAVRQRHAKTPT